MYDYKWCVCDMDGTLLNSEDMIAKEDETALKRLQEGGMEVMIASGRLDLMVMRYIHQLNLQGHVISCNGGLIRNIKTGEIVYSNAMDKNIVGEMFAYVLEHKIDFFIYTPNVVFSNRENPRAARYEGIHRNLPKELSFEIRYLRTPDMSVFEGMEILKVLFILTTSEQVDYYIDKYSVFNELEVVSSSPGLVDIMAAGSSKGRALKILADRQGVDLKEVIAFGDNYNDIDMLQCVGMPVAMENSVEELKAVAKFITKSNDECGVAHALKHCI